MKKKLIPIILVCCLLAIALTDSYDHYIDQNQDKPKEATLGLPPSFSPRNKRGTRGVYDNWAWEKQINITENSGANLTGYQVKIEIQGWNASASNYINWSHFEANGDDIRFANWNKSTSLPYWVLSFEDYNSTIWVKTDNLTASTTQSIYMYYGNTSATSESNGDNVFGFFENFTARSGNVSFLTNWTKSPHNPIHDLNGRSWITGFYNDYDDRVYLFRNDNQNSNDMEAWSFNRTDYDNASGSWTNYGAVFTTTQPWSDTHVEFHGFVFETQEMADHREGVGAGLGTRKWRVYYDGTDNTYTVNQDYQLGYATANETDPLTWTEYGSNPIYNRTGTYGFQNNKAGMYGGKVWMSIGCYKSGVTGEPWFLTSSEKGNFGWENTTINWQEEKIGVGSWVTFNNGFFVMGTPQPIPYDEYGGYFLHEGEGRIDYASQPLLTNGTGVEWDAELYWNTIICDKNGSYDINNNGTTLMYYMGINGSDYKMGLAIADTLTNQSYTSSPYSEGWDNISGDYTIVTDRLKATGDGVDNDWCEKRIYPSTPIYALEGKVEFAQTNKQYCKFAPVHRFNDADLDSLVAVTQLHGHNDGFIYYQNTAGYQKSSKTYSANTNYTFMVVINSTDDKVSYYFDDTTLAEYQTFKTLVDPNVITLGHGVSDGTYYLDYLFIRQYVDPDTTVSLGPEVNQSSPSPPAPNYDIIVLKDDTNSTASQFNFTASNPGDSNVNSTNYYYIQNSTQTWFKFTNLTNASNQINSSTNIQIKIYENLTNAINEVSDIKNDTSDSLGNCTITGLTFNGIYFMKAFILSIPSPLSNGNYTGTIEHFNGTDNSKIEIYNPPSPPAPTLYNISLYKDVWNFNGYPNSTTKTSAQMYALIPNCTAICGKNMTSGYWYTYWPALGMTEAWNIVYGDGLYILVEINVTWQIGNYTNTTTLYDSTTYNPVVYAGVTASNASTIYSTITNCTAVMGKNITTGYWYTYWPGIGLNENFDIVFGDGLFILVSKASSWNHT